MRDTINWKCIYKTPSEFEARAIQGNLEEGGIKAVLLNKRDSSFTIGYVELHVPEDQEAEALLILEDQKEEDGGA